jgi:delta 1-pyrroline-5-carboxylate dehydrogenase
MAGIADAGAAGSRRRDAAGDQPAEPKDIVGYVREASEAEVQALTSAVNNAPIWFATPPQERAAILGAAVLMESRCRP